MIIKCLLVFIILIVFFMLLIKKETFQMPTNVVNELNVISDVKKDSNNSINLVDVMLDDDTLLKYLNKKELEEETEINNPLSNKLPLMIDNEYKEYNHELRKLINDKKIYQNFVIDLLKNNIKLLLNKTTNINELK